jgi:hypothetical protein
MRAFFDGIKKSLILRKPRSGCLEGRTVLIPIGVNSFTGSLELAHQPASHREAEDRL